MPRRARPEDQIQRAVFQHLAARAAPNVVAFHPFNGGYRRPTEAAIANGLGVLAGVPDVIAIAGGAVYCLEIKAEGGKLTPAQINVHDRLRQAGAHVATAYGLDVAIRQLEAWHLLRGTAATRIAERPAQREAG